MKDLSVRLFGQLEIKSGNTPLDKLPPVKVQELFVYLLLFRNRPHTREVLAELLWPGAGGKQGMKYLRHTLWQLQDSIGHDFLELDGQWVSINPDAKIWVDIVQFKKIVDCLRENSGLNFDKKCADKANTALSLYKGNLFDGCYKDWCIVERERYQHHLLHLLDKLIFYCEINNYYELGLDYGAKALQIDMAHERIHRRLMRLHNQEGNRAAAIRQYEQCKDFLHKGLDAQPSQRTLELHEQIRQKGDTSPASVVHPPPLKGNKKIKVVNCLTSIQTTMNQLQSQLEEVLNSMAQTPMEDP